MDTVKEAIEIFSKHQDYASDDEMKRGSYLREYDALCYFQELDGFSLQGIRKKVTLK